MWGHQLELDEFMAAEPPGHLQAAEPGMEQMSREEMNFCVAQFVEYPTLWLQCGSGPFIHPSLYENGLPTTLQSAFSAAAVYATITPENSAIAWPVIENLASSVLNQSSLGVSAETTADLLARVQALCILQIIRLFGPDIRQRHLAELAEPVLVSFTESLVTRTVSECSICASNAQSWRSWIFSESIRRTIIMSFMIRGVYSLVKYGFCSLAPVVSTLSFTAQKHLWKSKSAREWHDVRRGRGEHWIDRMQFSGLISEAGKPDIEEMGILMSVTYCGRMHVEEWLGRDTQVDFPATQSNAVLS
jgi:hypothetical protein